MERSILSLYKRIICLSISSLFAFSFSMEMVGFEHMTYAPANARSPNKAKLHDKMKYSAPNRLVLRSSL